MRKWLPWVIFAVSFVVAFLLGLGLASLAQRRAEVKRLVVQPVQIPKGEANPEVWGKAYPLEYSRFVMTKLLGDSTRYGGSIPFSHLERWPELQTIWAGYGFTVEYNEDRGHMWSLEDVRHTGRQDPARGGKPGPGTCLTCKSGDVPRLMNEMGVAEFYAATFEEVNAKAQNPISCSDCHDPNTMELVLTRPALKEGLASMGIDTTQLTRNQMRSLVCAQCHSEYYFRNPGSYLVFPWANGLKYEQIEAYYDSIRFSDWVNAVSGTSTVKFQHPEYEIFTTSVHYKAGVTCADCHMPYRVEGGTKFTDHYVRSPLFNVEATCGRCHGWSEEEAKAIVYEIQDRHQEMLKRGAEALVAAHNAIAEAAKAGATDKDLEEARKLLRHAQMRWDFVFSSNSHGFHSPQEMARLLAAAIDLARQAEFKAKSLTYTIAKK